MVAAIADSSAQVGGRIRKPLACSGNAHAGLLLSADRLRFRPEGRAAGSVEPLASGSNGGPFGSGMPVRWRISTFTASIVRARQLRLDAKFSMASQSFRKTFIARSF